MDLRSDYLVDRRRLKRSITLWRVITVLAAVALVARLADPSTNAWSSFKVRASSANQRPSDDRTRLAITA